MCDVTGCRFIGTHRTTISALEGKLRREVNLCEEHWFLFNEEDQNSAGISAFKQRLKEIDNGRFTKLIDAISVTDECQHCFYLTPKVTNSAMGYRCRCAGSCIAATLSNEVKSYLFWKLGEITKEQHIDNVNSDKFQKLEFLGHITYVQWDTVYFCYQDEYGKIVGGNANINKFHRFTPDSISKDTKFRIQFPQCDFTPIEESDRKDVPCTGDLTP
jgi:hypothetical protein